MAKKKTKFKTLYHGTDYRNLGSILGEGLRASMEGGVYLTDSADSAMRWTAVKIQAMGGSKVLVVEVKVEESKLIEGMDHSPMMQELFGCGTSKIYTDAIPPEMITNYIKYGD